MARLPISRVSVTTTRCQYQLGEVNKFEQVSSDDHQISITVGGGTYPGPMSGGGVPRSHVFWGVQ